jgi:hypothetical protein
MRDIRRRITIYNLNTTMMLPEDTALTRPKSVHTMIRSEAAWRHHPRS